MNFTILEKTRWVALFLFLHCWNSGHAEEHFSYNSSIVQAYQKAVALRLDESAAILARLKRQDPQNLAVYHIENYLDFFRLYINEDAAEYAALKKHLDQRLAKIRAGDQKSPYYLYAQGDIFLQWSLVKLKFGDYLGAFSHAGKAYRLLSKNQERFPQFMPNYKDLGLLHALVGTIPDNYQWGVKLLGGMQGSIAQGKAELEKVLRHARQNEDFLFADETVVYYAFMVLHLENDANAAWKILQNQHLDLTKNPLHCFLKASVALRSGHNDEAIAMLSKYNKPGGTMDFPMLEFQLGLAKLRRLDADAAPHFSNFLGRFRGRNNIKEAYQKLAWTELIKGNATGYKRYLQLCSQRGVADFGSDKNAQEEAQSGLLPEAALVRARLLFDGGYFQTAYDLLKEKENYRWPNKAAQLEYTYRQGRILHGLARWDEAMALYRKTIAEGRETTHYYACNAALQAGLICELRKDYPQARRFFQLCTEMRPSDYRTSLHQAAKAGLSRVLGF
ncbi:hypothetical protein [Haliscomenobacter hydrossis]|uniref:TPR repeat-containing protein n=1 Tax=Haliscomenobacter hydrossis (strain ATCC 27775 / DSM 1100 / LMG 10767 / O) TaxID=760192 RepID=F4L352_HALH1|nr:hypothetical protein [Haliscomenobacter hydrossis]AEE50711.1 TPR repeat-containing protein [Haliscomenobacter hydrossis DSM 1100]